MSKIQKYKKEIEIKDQYIAVPIWFIKQTSNKDSPFYLTPFERELYCLITGLCKNGECYANDFYFHEVFNVTIKHVNKSIHKLETLKLIFIFNDKNKRTIKSINLDRGSVNFCFNSKDKCTYITFENNIYKVPSENWRYLTDNDIDYTDESNLTGFKINKSA
ncbi:hypothetical protein [Bizionia sp.]|uniref:hypothetical protein n=1 Tax=Bizionia sp. TaxID=1954480 RepID=UPI003A92F499